MNLVLATWLLLSAPPAYAQCQADGIVLEQHVNQARLAWRRGEDAPFQVAHAQLLQDLACLAGSGFRTKNAELFVVLALGALDAGQQERLMAALRALLVVSPGYALPDDLVPQEHELRAAYVLAQELGPDVTGFAVLYLGKEPPAPSAPAAPAPAPDPTVIEARLRAQLLAEVRLDIEQDKRLRQAGIVTATLGGAAAGLSTAFLLAMVTTGDEKPFIQFPERRAVMKKVWTGTAIGGVAVTGLGIWMVRASGVGCGPGVGVGLRF